MQSEVATIAKHTSMQESLLLDQSKIGHGPAAVRTMQRSLVDLTIGSCLTAVAGRYVRCVQGCTQKWPARIGLFGHVLLCTAAMTNSVCAPKLFVTQPLCTQHWLCVIQLTFAVMKDNEITLGSILALQAECIAHCTNCVHQGTTRFHTMSQMVQ